MTAPCIQTRSGVAFDLLAPTTDMVRREDIAHSLARLARYNGHTIETWTVAEHSLLVADLLASWGCPVAVVREGLLHDAGEAYYGDITSPVKRARDVHLEREAASSRAAFEAHGPVVVVEVPTMEVAIDRVVRTALSLPETETPIVKRADLVALAIERRDLMVPCERDWSLPEYAPRDWPKLHTAASAGYRTSPGVAVAVRFLERWEELDAEVLSEVSR